MRAIVEQARTIARLQHDGFNVVRFARDGERLSLLLYPDFFDVAFPVLELSCVVDLREENARTIRYDGRANAPVLHRKETLLGPAHPRRSELEALTKQAESFGLFEDARTIGTRQAWEARLARLGLRVDGHRLVPRSEDVEASGNGDGSEVVVHRHRTALQRYSLSSPMQALFRHGYLDGRGSVFDYGCGRGDDLRILRTLGLTASGWDPHFAPTETRSEADVVNLGFVINVIENAGERAEALRGAYSLARRVLAVAALIGGRTVYEEKRLFGDGLLTSRGTFQKYFQQQELREYIESVLGREPIAVGPGLFLVFRDDDEEQNFLAARQTLGRCGALLPRAAREERAKRTGREERAPRKPTRWETHLDLIEDFWQQCLRLGRAPRPDEYDRFEELRGNVGSPKTVLARLVAEKGADSLDLARRGRMDDILVYLSLNTFEQRRSRRHIAPSLKADVVTFWGTIPAAEEAARNLLFSIAQPTLILEASKMAATAGLGHLDGTHSLTVHRDAVPRLPPILRVYVQCATVLFGELDEVDLVKVHVESGKVTLLRYDQFDDDPLPALRERIKVNLRRQRVDFFPSEGDDHQLCFPKSRVLRPDDPSRERHQQLEEALRTHGLDVTDYGCQRSALTELLDRHGLEVDVAGIALRPKRRSHARGRSLGH